MARNVTLTAIKEDIRQRCDLDTFSSTTFVTDTAVTRMINTSIQSLAGVLMCAWGDGYFTTQATITTTADVGTSSLPSNFLRLVGLWWIRATDDPIPVRIASHDERILGHFSSRAWNAPAARLRHNTLVWLPIPNAAYTVKIEYVYAPEDLSAGTDTFDGGAGWDEWVVLDVCRKIRQREEKDPSEFMIERDRVEQAIIAFSPQRAETHNPVIRDVDLFGMGDHELRDWAWRRS